MTTATAIPVATIELSYRDEVAVEGGNGARYSASDMRSYTGSKLVNGRLVDQTPEESEASARASGRECRHEYVPVWLTEHASAIVCRELQTAPAPLAATLRDGDVIRYRTIDGLETVLRLTVRRGFPTLTPISGHFVGGW